MQTALAMAVACLEMLLILLWMEAANELAFPWFELSFFALLGWINSPLWLSTVVRKLFKGVDSHDTFIAYLMFGIPLYFFYLVIFVFG